MFRWKEYVCEVYKERSISKAAEALYISQPSLSAKIKGVEEKIGYPLFDRSRSPLGLTEVGKAYVTAAEEIAAIETGFKDYVNDLKSLKSGEIFIGASNIFAAYALPPIVTEFQSMYPEVKVRLTEGNTHMLGTLLSNGTIDMVIDNAHYDADLYEKELYSDELILLAVPNSYEVCSSISQYRITPGALTNGSYTDPNFPTLPLGALRDVPFIMLSPNNDTRARGERLCREAGFRPNIVLELDQQSTAYMVSTTGMGAAFVSDTVVRKLPSHEKLNYYKLSGDSARRKVYFYYRKHKFKTKAMEEFIRLIRK